MRIDRYSYGVEAGNSFSLVWFDVWDKKYGIEVVLFGWFFTVGFGQPFRCGRMTSRKCVSLKWDTTQWIPRVGEPFSEQRTKIFRCDRKYGHLGKCNFVLSDEKLRIKQGN